MQIIFYNRAVEEFFRFDPSCSIKMHFCTDFSCQLEPIFGPQGGPKLGTQFLKGSKRWNPFLKGVQKWEPIFERGPKLGTHFCKGSKTGNPGLYHFKNGFLLLDPFQKWVPSFGPLSKLGSQFWTPLGSKNGFQLA